MAEEKFSESDLPTSIFAGDFSPDGEILITASLGGTLAEWHADTGERRRILLDPKGIEDENPQLFIVEEGKKVEAPFHLRRLSESQRGSSLLSVRFSPDGKYFGVGAANGEVVVWNAQSRGELFNWSAHKTDVVALDISADRKWLATGALEDGGTTFRVWRLQEYPVDVKEVISDCRHVCGVWAVCFSPDGRTVAAGGWTMSGYTAPQLYDVESGKHLDWLYWDMTRAMRFSPDGRHILTGDEFGSVKLWKIGEHEPVFELKAHKDIACPVGFSPDGKRFYSACAGEGIKVWETETERLLGESAIDGRILACRFADEGRTLVAASAAQNADHPNIHKLTGLPYRYAEG